MEHPLFLWKYEKMENKEIKDFHPLNIGNVQGKEVFHPSKTRSFEGNRKCLR